MAPARRILLASSEWLPLILLGASLGLNVYLGLGLGGRPAAARGLVPGARMPNLIAAGPEGGTKTVNWGEGGRPTLLYIFSPSCAWCRRNDPNFSEVARVSGSQYNVVGFSLSAEGLKEYLSHRKIAYPVYVSLGDGSDRAFTNNPTPSTVLISANGVVEEVLDGAYSGAVKKRIETRFGVRLPGYDQEPR